MQMKFQIPKRGLTHEEEKLAQQMLQYFTAEYEGITSCYQALLVEAKQTLTQASKVLYPDNLKSGVRPGSRTA